MKQNVDLYHFKRCNERVPCGTSVQSIPVFLRKVCFRLIVKLRLVIRKSFSCILMYFICPIIDLFADTTAIFISIVSNSYYGMPRGQIHFNLPPEHPIMSFGTIKIKWLLYLQKGPLELVRVLNIDWLSQRCSSTSQTSGTTHGNIQDLSTLLSWTTSLLGNLI